MEREEGLTLVELIVVIVLLGTITTVLVTSVVGIGKREKRNMDGIRMEKVANALEQYKLRHGSYPEKLEHLAKPPADRSVRRIALMKKKELIDLYGNRYRYELNDRGRSFRLIGYGEDGVKGGEEYNEDFTITPE